MSLMYVENLSVSFDGFKALDINTFIIEENELRVVIGPNGAGKTTFLDCLCGKTKPDTGSAMLDDKDLTKLSEKEIVDVGVGRKFQTPTIFPSLTVMENMMLAFKTKRGVFSSLFYKMTKKEKDRIFEVAERAGLKEHLQQTAGSLSHGQKQWLEISMVILQEPRLMLIDEPAAGMTDEETHKTGEWLKELSSHRSIIVIEHDMTFVRQIANLVTVLHQGKVLVEGPMEEVQSNPKVIECYLGSSHH